MKKRAKVKRMIIAHKKKMMIIFLLAFMFGIGGFTGYTINKMKSAEACLRNMSGVTQLQQDTIAYKTFTSPNADFTFQYPASWTYTENRDSNKPELYRWIFYKNAEQSANNIVLEAGYLTEAVDLFSGNIRKDRLAESKASYWVRTYPSNDKNTFITQENLDTQDSHGGYIYWQKGKYLVNADDVTDYYGGTVHMISYNIGSSSGQISAKDLETGYRIIQHIAKSISVK